MVIGVVDTGGNFDHPSLAAQGADGYVVTNPLGSGVFLGDCNGPGAIVTCNDKVFGAYDFMTPMLPPADATNGPGGGEDENGHGTHVASTAAGNVVNTTFNGLPVQISGVAPHANIIVYDGCYTQISSGQGACPSAATSAGIDQAVADGVDVINYSIAGGNSPWGEMISIAFQAATNAGIVVATGAGNDGPTPGTTGHIEPWAMTAAASFHDRVFSDAQITVLGPGVPGPALENVPAMAGSGPELLADFTDDFQVSPANIDGCSVGGGFPPATFSGIALVRRGACNFSEKVANAVAAGATGVVVYNNRAGAPIVMGALQGTSVPSAMVSQADGLAIRTFLEANPTATGELGPDAARANVAGAGDIVAGFSSRGPGAINVMKPNLAAPGADIFAGVADSNASMGTPAEYDVYSGTSMASPHNAGAALLLRALKPSWSPIAVQSALATTGVTAMFLEDGVTPANPFERGAGRVDVRAAVNAGLLMDETNAAFTAANPEDGGDPRTLNLPGIMSDACVFTCSFVRRFTNTTSGTASWDLTLDLPPGVMGSTTPAGIANLAAGATADVTIDLDVGGADLGEFLFAQLNLTPAGAPPPSGVPSVQHLPIAVMRATASLPDLIRVDTRRDAGSQVVEGLATQEATDFDIRSSGLVVASRPAVEISQDPTPNNPYDNVSQVFVTTVNVPAGTSRLVVEAESDESLDTDIFVGTGVTPTPGTQTCSSATFSATERCELTDPAPGTYWILVQSWEGSGAQPDVIDVWYAVVPEATVGGMGSLHAKGPEDLDAGEPYAIRVFWNQPALAEGDRAYGELALGSTPADVGDLGEVSIALQRAADDVIKSADVATAEVGETVTYTISVQPNIAAPDLSYTVTDAIPAGMAYVNASATANSGNVSVAGSTLTWSGVQAGTAGIGVTYTWTNSVTDPLCRTGVAPPHDLYADLVTINPALVPDPMVSGDTVAFNAYGTGAQFSFYDVNYTGLTFTDDGFVVFDAVNDYGGFPWLTQAVPDAEVPNNLIAMFWKDLEIVHQAGTRGVTLASADPDVAIIEYDDVQLFGDPANQYDFEIIMTRARSDAPGAYEYRIAFDNMTGTQADAATIGGENAGGTSGTAAINNVPTNIANRTVFCADAVTPAAGPVAITYQAVVQPSVNNTTVTNTAVHNTDNPGSMAAGASASVVIGAPVADLSITKTDGVTEVDAGGSVTYTIEVTNGSANDSDATVADTFAAPLTGCEWTCAASGNGDCTAAGNGDIADAITVAAGGTVTYTAICDVAANAVGTISNTATVTGANDPDDTDDSATDETDVVPQIDLSISKTDNATDVGALGTTVYTIIVSNGGAAAAANDVLVSDDIPAPLSCEWTCQGAGGGTCTADNTGDIADTVDLPAGASVTYTATCDVNNHPGPTLVNAATVEYSNDPDENNNTATDNTTVTPPPDQVFRNGFED